MNRKIIILLVLLLILIIVTVICICCTNLFNNHVTELQFRITWDDISSRGRAINRIVEQYNESQKKIHVTMIGGDENRENYLEALFADNVDVYMVPYRYLRDSEITDELMVLDEIYRQQEQYFYDTVKSLAQSDKGPVGIPWIGHSMGLIYNKTLVSQAGIDIDEMNSMDSLLDACKKIVLNTDVQGIGLVGANSHDLSWMVSQFIYSFGGSLAETDEKGIQTKVTIDSPESAQALDFYINGLGQYAQDGWHDDTGVEVMEAFSDGEIAFEIQGPWGITDIWKKGNQFEVGAISLSQLGMYSEVGPLLLSVSKDTLCADAAKDFIEYLTEKDTLEKVMDGEYDEKYQAYYPYRVPLRKDMEDSDFFRKYPEFLVFIEGFEMPSINTVSEEWEEEYKNLYEYYLHEAIIGEISIGQALEYIENKKPE